MLGFVEVAYAFVPDGSCAIIVASRTTIAEVEAFAQAHPQIDYGPVYRSRNGWFAISAGTLRADEAAGRLSVMKSAGAIPRDSYCSDGSAYVGVALTSLGSGVPSSALPVQLGLFDEFDARPMSVAEKRYLQASLALGGYYNALLDGVWGGGSQASLERYSWAEFGEEPTNLHAAAAMLEGWIELDDGEWKPAFYSEFNVSLLLPFARIQTVEWDASFIHLQDSAEALDVFVSRSGPDHVGRVHGEAVRAHTGVVAPYTLRERDLWVTSIVSGNVLDYYRSRFDPRRGEWTTVIVDYVAASTGAELVISSIADGPGVPLVVPSGSRSERHIAEIAAYFSDEGEEVAATDPIQPSVPTSRPGPEEERGPRSGTGFFVDAEGSILTNAHVVDGCTDFAADGRPVEVQSASETFDLAILRPTDGEGADAWLPFAERPAGLNADITIAGYPLHGFLGGLNVTRGTISSLKGLGGDETNIQISAPVQPGNSGGPMVNNQGQVVGVVVAKLDAMYVADAIGDMPQNVNFAIRGELAKMVLSANGVRIDVEPESEPLKPEEVAERLQAATVLIECN